MEEEGEEEGEEEEGEDEEGEEEGKDMKEGNQTFKIFFYLILSAVVISVASLVQSSSPSLHCCTGGRL